MKERLEAALGMDGQPIGWGTMAHDHDIYMLLVEIAAEQEDLVSLKEFTPLLEELAIRDGHRLYTAIARRARGIIHRLESKMNESEMHLREALVIFEELRTHWQIGRTSYQLGVLARQMNDEIAASVHFAGALKEFELLQAKSDVERTQMELESMNLKASIAAS